MHLQEENLSLELVQLFHQADQLKEGVVYSNTGEISWSKRLELQRLYEQILLTDVNYAIEKHVEQTLWNFCYKFCFDALERKIRQSDKKPDNNNNSDVVALYSLCLMNALGSFLQFLTKFAIKWKISVPGFQTNVNLGILTDHWKTLKIDEQQRKENVLYIVQFCLIHIGDIVRYQKSSEQAESYYLHAIKVAPYNGHPYNQLAILETSYGNRLAAIYFYIRSVACKNPFALAHTNLEKAFELAISTATSRSEEKKPELLDFKITPKTYTIHFIWFVALVHQCEDFSTAQTLCSSLQSSFMICLKAGLKAWDIFHMFVISMGSIWTIFPGPDGTLTNGVDHQNYLNGVGQLCAEEQRSLSLLLQLLMMQIVCLSQFLLKAGPSVGAAETKSLLEYFPALKIACDWIKCHGSFLKMKNLLPETSLADLGGSFCLLFTVLLQAGPVKRPKAVKDAQALPEDLELIEFLPLSAAHTAYDFSLEIASSIEDIHWHKMRILRILNFGQWFANFLGQPALLKCDVQNGKPVFSSVHAASVLNNKNVNQIPVSPTGDIKESAEGNSPGSGPESKATTPSVKRPSKLVALRSILEKGKTPGDSPPPAQGQIKQQLDKEKEGVPSSEPPVSGMVKKESKIKIAAPGSSVEIPLVGERKDSASSSGGGGLSVKFEELPESTSSRESAEAAPGKANANTLSRIRYELPPRFQAAKLKLALGGKNYYSVGTASQEDERGGSPFDGGHQAEEPEGVTIQSFPPLRHATALSAGGSTSGGGVGAVGRSLLANFTESVDYEQMRLDMSPKPLDGVELSEPIGADRMTDFPKTPGVRPHIPANMPAFPFPTSAAHPFQSSRPIGSGVAQARVAYPETTMPMAMARLPAAPRPTSAFVPDMKGSNSFVSMSDKAEPQFPTWQNISRGGIGSAAKGAETQVTAPRAPFGTLGFPPMAMPFPPPGMSGGGERRATVPFPPFVPQFSRPPPMLSQMPMMRGTSQGNMLGTRSGFGGQQQVNPLSAAAQQGEENYSLFSFQWPSSTGAPPSHQPQSGGGNMYQPWSNDDGRKNP